MLTSSADRHGPAVSGMNPAPISVAVAVDAWTVPAWAALVVDQLLEAPFVELRGAVLMPARDARPPGARALHALERIDRRLSRAPLDALGPTPLSAAVPVAAGLDGAPPDVLIDLTATGVPLDLAAATADRVWRLQHPGGAGLGDATAAFWVLRAHEPVLATELVACHRGQGRPLYRSTSTVSPRSLYRSRNAACWKSAHFVRRCLNVAACEGWDVQPQTPASQPWPVPPPHHDRPPTIAGVLAWAGRTFAAAARHAVWRRSRPGRWSVALRRAPADGRLPHGLPGGHALVPPPASDYADPFLHRRGDRLHLFIEEVEHARGRGVISCCEVAPDGRPGRPRVVLEEPFHLSYPHVFEYEGRVYMIPETAEAGEIRLYAASRYPDRWRLERVLLGGMPAFDPTLVRHDGRLWLFAVVPVPGGPNTDELSLFHAERLEGPWRPHPANPVVSDARCARPAGRVLRIGNALVRPAQDCSRDYGYAVTFQRIDVLTPTDYRESTIGRLEPGWAKGNLRTHTYNREAGFEVVDTYRR
jgi:hypothetical protein